MNKTIGAVIFSILTACSGTQVVVDQQTAVAATNAAQANASAAQSFATSTPPSGATSMGTTSSPQAGPATLPIDGVDVYTFQGSLSSDGSDDETLYWAALDDGTVYVWGEIDIDCVDDAGNETGDTGTADLVYEVNGSDYGWMTATDSCGYSSYFGCSSSGGDEVCGGCDFDSESIDCTALSS
jgi:hypothetical protein